LTTIEISSITFHQTRQTCTTKPVATENHSVTAVQHVLPSRIWKKPFRVGKVGTSVDLTQACIAEPVDAVTRRLI